MLGSKESNSGRADASAGRTSQPADVRHVDDVRLMERIVAGDHAAFALLYDRHAPRVLGLLIRSLRHRADAEDVLQDTFHQVWRSSSQYAPQRSSPEVWVMLIARSRLLDFLRRRRSDASGSLAHTEAAPTDPLASLTRDEAAQHVHAALARLPDEQRAVISLAFFGGLTHRQVAEQQEIPLGTAKTRILLGIRSLRNSLSVFERTSR